MRFSRFDLNFPQVGRLGTCSSEQRRSDDLEAPYEADDPPRSVFFWSWVKPDGTSAMPVVDSIVVALRNESEGMRPGKRR